MIKKHNNKSQNKSMTLHTLVIHCITKQKQLLISQQLSAFALSVRCCVSYAARFLLHSANQLDQLLRL